MNSLRHLILAAAADPNIALALVILGALCVYAEFMAPGKVIPGAAGSVLMLLGLRTLAAFSIAPAAIAMLLFAAICIFFNAMYRNSHALAGLGTLAFVFGARNLADGRIRLTTAAGLGIPFALLSGYLLSIAVRARRNKTLDAQA